jgi:nitrogen regulatory protein PII
MTLLSCHKLLLTVVKKGKAKKIVQATRQAGAEGGTMLLGMGTGILEKTFFGIPISQEKEIILTLITAGKAEATLQAVAAAGRLEEAGNGIALVVDVSGVAGIAHHCESNDFKERQEMQQARQFELIVTVINKGNAQVVVDASKRAGAEGGTILFGRGTGIHEQATLFSIPIEPEKELVLTLIDRARTEAVLQAIRQDTGLDEPGKGIAFVLPVERTVGIKHLEQLPQEKAPAPSR